ncbi:MAG TPA: PAS domain S-box protein [Methylocystis sp.]|jgi:PAS domain S-box-containing protein
MTVTPDKHALFVSLAENSHEFIGMCDAEFTPFYVNPAGLRMVGLVDLEEAKRTQVKEFFFPEDRSFVMDQFFPKVLRVGRGETVLRFRHFRTGEALWMNYSVFLLEDASGRFGGLGTVSRNITEAKRAEEALRQSREDFVRAQEVAQVGWWRLDTQRNVLTWSGETHRIFGFPKGRKLTYESFLDFVHPEDRDYVNARWMSALTGEPYDIEHRIVVDGRVKWVREKAYLEFDQTGRLLGGFGVTQDITDRKRADEALRESEARFTSFMRHLPGLAWIKNHVGQYIFANDAAEKAFQIPLAELYGKTDEQVFPPDTASQFRANDRIALASNAGFTTTETLAHTDGVLHHSLVSKFPIWDAVGSFSGIGGVAIDITERVIAEGKLLEATERLREADKRKDEFLAMLAHELRNPLAPIRTGLQVLRRSGSQNQVAERIQDIMERQVEHLVRLVDDLLEASRIARGKIKLKIERVSLAAAVRHAVDISRDLIDANELELRVALPDDPLFVDGDPVRLAQIFSNLLNNAAKFTDPGGRVEIAGQRIADEAVVSVTDTGVGISKDMLPRVFDLFSQSNCTLDRTHGGLGIGLALVRELVELHRGKVEASSEGEGKGSRFVVRLPLLTSAQPNAPQPQRAMHAGRSARRVLVIDDARDVGDSLALLLAMLGAEVRIAYSGAEGLAVCAEFEPELILLDIGMPEMDGFETARRLREQGAGRKAMLVALTGWGEEETRRRVYEAGFDRHLTKPANLERIEALLEAAPSNDQ